MLPAKPVAMMRTDRFLCQTSTLLAFLFAPLMLLALGAALRRLVRIVQALARCQAVSGLICYRHTAP